MGYTQTNKKGKALVRPHQCRYRGEDFLLLAGQCMDASATGQILGWIDRFSLAANLEMEFDAVSIGLAHFGNLLSFIDLLVLLDQQGLVVSVCAQKSVVVLQDDQVAVTSQTRTCIHNMAVCGGQNRIARFAANVKTLVFHIIKTSE
jgi:hypothetical protein